MASQGGALPESVALPLMREVALGMAAAADEGIVHRDLKPSNVLVDAAGHARVVDFGLARGPLPEASLSLSGQVVGTPFYMAPEQWEDPRGLDTRADVYSFGGTFYHALTGVAPFGGRSAVAVLLAHKTEPLISPRARNPRLSERIAEVLERCLAKRPAARFASFHELGRALEPDAGSAWDEPDDPALAPHLARYLSRRADYLLRRLEEMDVYEFPAGRRLLVRPGSLAEVEADALVSSDDGSLSMSSGVSRALRETAGPEFLEAARRCAPARPGRCVVTPAGRLPARFVFHGITLDPGKGRVDRPSRDLISEIVSSCLYQADSLFVETLAFPLLGTGNAGLPEDVCLDTLFRALARALHGGGSGVREASIVLWSRPRS
jgi:O-acetyl-ADP-ribose deacetylase (regulator of RNase III)